jgi:hypothetical protein
MHYQSERLVGVLFAIAAAAYAQLVAGLIIWIFF